MFKLKYILKYLFVGLSILSFSVTGCKSKHEVMKETGDNLVIYDAAVENFNKGRDLVKRKKGGSYNYFQRAEELYKLLVVPYRGTAKAEEVSYGLAYSTYFLGVDLNEARYLFKTLADEFPEGKYAEEARFMVARCLYEDAPTAYSLDQSSTIKALEAIQLFLEFYPETKRKGICNDMIDELRFKLETKSFQNSKQYVTIGDYRAATVALKNTMRDYPGTIYREEAEFLIIKSHYLFARNSIYAKQDSRYNDCLDAFYNFKEAFPESIYMDDANWYYTASVEAISVIERKQALLELKELDKNDKEAVKAAEEKLAELEKAEKIAKKTKAPKSTKFKNSSQKQIDSELKKKQKKNKKINIEEVPEATKLDDATKATVIPLEDVPLPNQEVTTPEPSEDINPSDIKDSDIYDTEPESSDNQSSETE